MAQQDIYVMDVLDLAVTAMQVQIFGSAVGTYHKINFNPGRHEQIVRALEDVDGTTLADFKYPLCAVEMPYDIDRGTGFYQVRFPRIVFADITITGEREEPVKEKYTLKGKFKTVLYPCVNEFIKRLAWSRYTSMGDPDAYSFTLRERPSSAIERKGVNDYVDVLDIIDLEATIFPNIKICK